MQCGAKNKTAGGTCKTPGMPNGRCRMHGGKSLVGLASPSFVTGRYSKHLPTRLLATYQEAMKDADLLALREEVALLDTRLGELIARVESGESGWLWRTLKEKLNSFREAKAMGDVPAMSAHLNSMETLIERGIADYAAWGEIQSLIQQRRKVVESERKRLVEMQQMITSERAMLLLAAVVDTVRKHVTDRGTLQAISNDIRGLIAA